MSVCELDALIHGGISRSGGVTLKLLKHYGAKSVAQVVPKFKSLAEVTGVLRHLGVDRCSLVLGIDFTGSNVKQGMCTVLRMYSY